MSATNAAHVAVPDVLAYEAPFVLEKLLKEGIADSADESAALFTEVKRYLLLGRHHRDETFAMYSRRVDAAWHSFVLFTEQYAEFCQRYFDMYLHHIPAEAPRSEGGPPRRVADFARFCVAYEALFGEKVPDLWRDHTSIALHRRLINDAVGRLRVEVDGDHAMLFGTNGDCLVTVNSLAAEALRFVAETRQFYVRELPGDLTDDEKLGLGEVFVEHELLRVG
jgi:hypothetical protein